MTRADQGGIGDQLIAGARHSLSIRDLLEIYLGEKRSADKLAELGTGWLRGRLPVEVVRQVGTDSAVRLMAMQELRTRWLHAPIDLHRPLRQISRLARYLDARHARLDQEVAGVVLLDDDGAMVGDVLLYRGFFQRLRVRTHVILGAVLRRGLNRFVFFHTHTGPSPIPSHADYRFHRRLLEACELTGVELADNLTIGAGGGYQSMFKAEEREWPESVEPPDRPRTRRDQFWWAAPVN